MSQSLLNYYGYVKWIILQNLERKGFRLCSDSLYYIAIVCNNILPIRERIVKVLTGCLRAPGWKEMGSAWVKAVAISKTGSCCLFNRPAAMCKTSSICRSSLAASKTKMNQNTSKKPLTVLMLASTGPQSYLAGVLQ